MPSARLGPASEEKSIGVDAAGIGAIVDELITEERGIEMKHIVAISQGYKRNDAVKDTERKVAGGGGGAAALR